MEGFSSQKIQSALDFKSFLWERLADSVEHVTLDSEIVSSSPLLGVEMTFNKRVLK